MLRTTFLLMALALAPAPQVWTVDDDGPADFASIVDAIPVVAAGDVLVVHPGTYAGFALSKSLSIVAPAGSARPKVGTSQVTGAADVEIVGIELTSLLLDGIPGRAILDDCVLGTPSANQATLDVRGCTSVVLTRCSVQGASNTAWFYFFLDKVAPALRSLDSNVSIAQSVLTGGDGSASCSLPDPMGAPALRVENGSVLVAASKLHGGDGDWSTCFFGDPPGWGGPAVVVKDAAFTIRGNANHSAEGGLGASNAPDGKSVALLGTSLLVASGVAMPDGISNEGGASTILQPTPAQPFLTVTGDDQAHLRRILVFGPAGEAALVGVSLAPSYLGLPGLEGPLWLDPTHVVLAATLTTVAQDQAASLLVPTPTDPALAGVSATVQAWFPGVPGALDASASLLSNPGTIVLH